MYPSDPNGYTDYRVVWTLPLAAPGGESRASIDGVPQLLLRLEDETLTLIGVYGCFGRNEHVPHRLDPKGDHIFLSVPLDAGKLRGFRRPDDDDSEEPWMRYKGSNALTCYEGNGAAGVSWRLWVHYLESCRQSSQPA